MSEIITIEDQNQISIKGATKINSATQSQAVVEIGSCTVIISGNNLEVKKLDLDNKEVSLAGRIVALKFNSHAEKQPFLKRLFK